MKKHIFNFLSLAALTAFFISVCSVECESWLPLWVCGASLFLFGAFAKIYEKLDEEENK